MRSHRDTGTAAPLSQTVTDVLRYDGSWWTLAENGWLRVTDTRLDHRLREHSTALALADRSVERHKTRTTATSPVAEADGAA